MIVCQVKTPVIVRGDSLSSEDTSVIVRGDSPSSEDRSLHDGDSLSRKKSRGLRFYQQRDITMGASASVAIQEQEARRRSRSIDDSIAQDRAREAKTVKILMLGKFLTLIIMLCMYKDTIARSR